MAKTFFPEISELVPASPPHPKDTSYKVSIGLENMNDKYHPIVKIQMVYNGKVSGQKNPSFPINTNDYERIFQAIKKLLDKKHDQMNVKEGSIK
ncbi:hypothetical protein K8T06_11050 [bacterium]|nr:hypothetical protein [bacterium]